MASLSLPYPCLSLPYRNGSVENMNAIVGQLNERRESNLVTLQKIEKIALGFMLGL
jgi:hypothetical protein